MTKHAHILESELIEALSEVPTIDIHTHLVGGRLGARGLHDIFLYHFLVSELYGSGCPTGARLSQYPEWPSTEEAHARIKEAIPFLPNIRNTSAFWGLRMILRDLYDWNQPITASNWQNLDDIIRERADDQAWHHSVLDRLHIKRTGTELARRLTDADDDRLQYAIEWAMFARSQWGHFDTALYELERTWGRPAESPAAIGGVRPPTERIIRTLDDVHAAMKHYIHAIPFDRVLSTAVTISTEHDYSVPTDAQMVSALKRRDNAGIVERDIYASYIQELFLTELEKYGDKIVYQFALSAEPLPFETGSRIYQRTLAQLAESIERHPKLRFQCFNASHHADQTLCTYTRELPNFSLSGIWWHNFYPTIMRDVISARLDMVPINKHVGFFSDAYVVEWTYGKMMLFRKQLASVLTAKILQGQYTRDEAISVARGILFETPQGLLGFKPRLESSKK